MYVELPEELNTTSTVFDAIREALHSKATFQTIDAQSKKEATMKFESTEEATMSEAALKDRFDNKNLRIIII